MLDWKVEITQPRKKAKRQQYYREWRRGAEFELNEFPFLTSRLCCSNINSPPPSPLLTARQATVIQLFFCFRIFSADLIIRPLLDFHREQEGNGKFRVELKWKCPCQGVFTSLVSTVGRACYQDYQHHHHHHHRWYPDQPLSLQLIMFLSHFSVLEQARQRKAEINENNWQNHSFPSLSKLCFSFCGPTVFRFLWQTFCFGLAVNKSCGVPVPKQLITVWFKIKILRKHIYLWI